MGGAAFKRQRGPGWRLYKEIIPDNEYQISKTKTKQRKAFEIKQTRQLRNESNNFQEEIAIATKTGRTRQSIPGLQKVQKIQKIQKTKNFTRTQKRRFYRKRLQSTSRDLAQVEQQWNEKAEQTRQNKESRLKSSLKASYGFTFDLNLSTQKNVNNIIGDMP